MQTTNYISHFAVGRFLTSLIALKCYKNTRARDSARHSVGLLLNNCRGSVTLKRRKCLTCANAMRKLLYSFGHYSIL
jgi:hypothetical protein